MVEGQKQAQVAELWPFSAVGVMTPTRREELGADALSIDQLESGEKYWVVNDDTGERFGIHGTRLSETEQGRVEFERLDDNGEPVFDAYRFLESQDKYGEKYMAARTDTLGLSPREDGQYSSVYITQFDKPVRT